MKKIMIYTKHGRSFRPKQPDVKGNADILLFFTVFICGTMIGSSLYVSVNTDNIFAYLTAQAMQYGVLFNILLRIAFCTVMFLACFMGGTGGAGIIILIFLPFLSGALYAMAASYFIMTSAANGLGRFALTVLPGGILYVTALILFCAESAYLSKQTAAFVFFGRNEDIDGKRYLIKSGMYFGLMIAAVFADHIMNLLFSGLFE